MKNIAADLTGQTFGKLLVVCRHGSDKHQKATWLCKCECGGQTIAATGSLRSGNTTSCCGRREVLGNAMRTHGRSQTGTYRIWKKLRARCENPSTPNFHLYGGRGITVCDRWSKFELFLKDVGERPSLAHSLDRIDNNKGYSPDNCRWATRKQQNRNTRRNHLLTMGGETECMAYWAERAGVTQDFLKKRIWAGWPLYLAISAPKHMRLRTAMKRWPNMSQTALE